MAIPRSLSRGLIAVEEDFEAANSFAAGFPGVPIKPVHLVPGILLERDPSPTRGTAHAKRTNSLSDGGRFFVDMGLGLHFLRGVPLPSETGKNLRCVNVEDLSDDNLSNESRCS